MASACSSAAPSLDKAFEIASRALVKSALDRLQKNDESIEQLASIVCDLAAPFFKEQPSRLFDLLSRRFPKPAVEIDSDQLKNQCELFLKKIGLKTELNRAAESTAATKFPISIMTVSFLAQKLPEAKDSQLRPNLEELESEAIFQNLNETISQEIYDRDSILNNRNDIDQAAVRVAHQETDHINNLRMNLPIKNQKGPVYKINSNYVELLAHLHVLGSNPENIESLRLSARLVNSAFEDEPEEQTPDCKMM